MKIPVVIINRDLLTWPSKMVEDLKTFDNIGDIIIVDNQSTYEPLLEWYKTNPCEIIYSPVNYGQSVPWDLKLHHERSFNYYVVTDPDMDLSETPKDSLTYLVQKMEEHPEYDRIGLTLSNYDLPEDSPYHFHVKTWQERSVPEDSIKNGLLTKQIFDTTFGMYNITRHFSGTSCCTQLPYGVKHIPWNITKDEIQNLKEKNYEFYYYLKNATSSASYKNFISFSKIYGE